MKPRTHYARGAEKERRIKRKYENMGWICIRSAGSHGFADVITIEPREKIIKFIQSKGKKCKDYQKRKLLKENEWINGTYTCYFEVI